MGWKPMSQTLNCRDRLAVSILSVARDGLHLDVLRPQVNVLKYLPCVAFDFASHLAEQNCQQTLLNVQAIFRFREDQRLWALHDLVADFQPAIRRQAMQHDCL